MENGYQVQKIFLKSASDEIEVVTENGEIVKYVPFKRMEQVVQSHARHQSALHEVLSKTDRSTVARVRNFLTTGQWT